MGYNLIMETESGQDRHFHVREGRNLIGRGHRCDVRITLPSVSTLHCEIMLENQRAILVNFDEITGTLHNGHRVEEALLAEDDVLQIGPVRFRVDRTSETPS